jgi:hypothetical protein
MQEFLIAPATGRAMWFLLLIPSVAMVLALGLLAVTSAGSRTSRFQVSADGLRLRGDLYGRLIPASQLKGSSIARVDPSGTSDLAPVRRTMGTGMPGYRAGWFRLRNGEKALLYLTDSSRAVYVQTTDGYSVMVSPTDPDQFVAALRGVATAN